MKTIREPMAKARGKSFIRDYVLFLVVFAVVVLLFQMHIMENHVIESSSSLHISGPTKLNSRTIEKGNVIKIHRGERDCDKIVDSDEDADDDMEDTLKILCRGGSDSSKNSTVVDRSSLHLSESIKLNSRTIQKGNEIKIHRGERDCDKIVDSDEYAVEDMKPILKILCRGGYDISKNSTTVDRSVLPKWSEILNFYGPPKILGLETCAIYRNKTKRKDRHVAPAGMFNTGTNLLNDLIGKNCDFENKKHKTAFAAPLGKHFEVPWGKHIPFTYRYNHTAHAKGNRYEGMDPSNTLPVLMVRDPYTWMQSMCKQPYAAQYDHNKSSCPNIYPYPSDIESHPRYGKMKYIPVHLKYDTDIRYKYESIAHLWNEWYLDYIKFHEDKSMKSPTDFPFIVIRLEDLTFHAETVIPKLCECGGGTVMGDGRVKMTTEIANGGNHAVDTSSGHMSGLLRSIVKYGNITRRRDGYPDFQLRAAKEVLDQRLMDTLGYSYEDESISKLSNS